MHLREVANVATRQRWIYLAVALAVIAVGLVWRLPGLGLPPFLAKYGGSVLWGAMVFFIVAAIWPSSRLTTIAAVAAGIAAAVEFSQALHVEWLDAIRSHAFGRLLLGRTFTWWDIAAYWAGIAVAVVGCRCGRLALTPPSSPPPTPAFPATPPQTPSSNSAPSARR